MPSNLETLAKRAGKSTKDAERYWKEGKESAKKKGLSEKTSDFWKYVMSITMRRLGLGASVTSYDDKQGAPRHAEADKDVDLLYVETPVENQNWIVKSSIVAAIAKIIKR